MSLTTGGSQQWNCTGKTFLLKWKWLILKLYLISPLCYFLLGNQLWCGVYCFLLDDRNRAENQTVFWLPWQCRDQHHGPGCKWVEAFDWQHRWDCKGRAKMRLLLPRYEEVRRMCGEAQLKLCFLLPLWPRKKKDKTR